MYCLFTGVLIHMHISVYAFQQCLYLQVIMHKVVHIIFSINNELFYTANIYRKLKAIDMK